ncbi:MAG: type II secretion system protein N [Burkholderiales bacterium]|nr:type II secretion system protein N [Burkholderiales bacterium]
MRQAAIAVVGFGVLLAALAGFAPATLVDHRVAAMTGGRLRITDATGTVWSGSGTLTDPRSTWQMPLRWSVSPRALATGALQVTLSPAAGARVPQGTITLDNDNAGLRDVAIDFPAHALSGALPQRDTVILGGDVQITSPTFEWNGERGSGTLNARWRDARLVVAGFATELGTVEIALAPQQDRLAGRIANTGGDVRIDGTVAVVSGTVAIDAGVVATPAAPAHVALALHMIGRADDSGKVHVGWRGKLQ